jgi:poly-gamma-glutamate system protein
MFRPSLKNSWSLLGLAILAILLYYIAQSSYVEIESHHYEEKVLAANSMSQALPLLKAEMLSLGYTIDTMNDPNETGLIGVNVSSITTSRGGLTDRLTTLNPNFSAVFIDLLKRAGLSSGDYVAVGLTGANPGANISLYIAMEVLGLHPVVITSLGAATYGANRELFTWLDMERVLYENGIVSFFSEYAAIGGTNDLGRGLPPEGRDNIILSIERNNRILIDGEDLIDNISLRMETYDRMLPEGQRYRAFINVGAGVGNVGSLVNAQIVSTGIQRRLGERDFREPGTMMHFSKRNIPIIHVYNIQRLVSEYNMPISPTPMPQPGTGPIFSTRINNVHIAIICLIVLILAIVVVIVFDRHDRKFSSNLIDIEEDL